MLSSERRNDILYSLAEGVFTDEEGINHKVYGITAVNVDGSIWELYLDLFFSKQKAKQFVSLCNKCELSLCHLLDVIEDAIA